jgi:hypothetical protein
MDGTTGPGDGNAAKVAARAARWPVSDIAVGVPVLAALGWGWLGRTDPALDPHGWPGYLLGLIGSLMMAAVLGFSWRKRTVSGRVAVGTWYNAHILLGLFGPVLVLIHARFAWGSINSSFALAATVLVVGSGLVARYALGPARRSGNRWAVTMAEAWHFLHLPLYVVLVLAVLLHVYMAHAY